MIDFLGLFLYTNNSRVGGYMTQEKQGAVESLIEEYVQNKGLTSVAEMLQIGNREEQSKDLDAVYKILLQQMIRERAKQDGKDIDALIQQERGTSNLENAKGQVLGSMSKVETGYIDILLEEAAVRNEMEQAKPRFVK